MRFIPPSNNKFIGRKNIWSYREQKKNWEFLIRNATENSRPEKPLKCAQVNITYFFPDKRRRDPDNYSGKFILDGLVRAGVLADDSFSNVVISLTGKYCKDCPRTEIEIEELE